MKMVTLAKLKEVEVEIKRYQKRVNELKKVMSRDKNCMIFISGISLETAAVKRASMDLSRALTKLRSSKD
jgi:hypothetical protein